MSENIQKFAKIGDILAISKLVEESISLDGTTVESKIHHGVTLELNVKSTKTLDPKICTQAIIKTLNGIQPAKITTVMIFGISNKQKWSKFLTLKSGKYAENTGAVKGAIFVTLATFACMICWAALHPDKKETQQECIKRVGDEIISRKRASGDTVVRDRAEIEAYGEEFKRKCNLVF
ncbi:hypothetical protein [Nostoc sp. ChiSLP03a]|uniref:hypothetical protein n=1 Tax=Nostoc sp. ChiSLP03a TaxID=3075380 RepID=UPI002AD24066|nr:hypothetical protein [Nostoc sp. ChiSLP03a]MDZ8212787.1 hypothetical protein [Nostoc sp. ChiSLP03a]